MSGVGFDPLGSVASAITTMSSNENFGRCDPTSPCSLSPRLTPNLKWLAHRVTEQQDAPFLWDARFPLSPTVGFRVGDCLGRAGADPEVRGGEWTVDRTVLSEASSPSLRGRQRRYKVPGGHETSLPELLPQCTRLDLSGPLSEATFRRPRHPSRASVSVASVKLGQATPVSINRPG